MEVKLFWGFWWLGKTASAGFNIWEGLGRVGHWQSLISVSEQPSPPPSGPNVHLKIPFRECREIMKRRESKCSGNIIHGCLSSSSGFVRGWPYIGCWHGGARHQPPDVKGSPPARHQSPGTPEPHIWDTRSPGSNFWHDTSWHCGSGHALVRSGGDTMWHFCHHVTDPPLSRVGQ